MHRRTFLGIVPSAFLLLAGGPTVARAQTATPAPGSGPLVDAAWLAAHAGDPSVVVVALVADDEYTAAHIPGAMLLEPRALGLASTDPVDVETWQGLVGQILGQLGVTPATTVVVYDNGSLYAPRLWWVLTHLGHPDARLLDGGLNAWLQAGGEVAAGDPPAYLTADPYPVAPVPAVLATYDDVTGVLGDPSTVIVDARPAEQYVEAHIPGAVNVPVTANYTADGLVKPVDELAKLYAAVGVEPGKAVVVYCNSGIYASTDFLALTLVGQPNVRVYTGSFNEWKMRGGPTES